MKKLLILILALSFTNLFGEEASEFFKRQIEKAQPIPMEVKKLRKLPPWLNNIPTNSPSNFNNFNTITEEELGTPTQNESGIAVNPTDPKNLIAAAVDYRDDGSRYVYVSFDGGETWENKNLGKVFGGWRSSNDPSVSFDLDGNGYLMYGAFISSNQKNGVFIAKTTDKGVTWDAHIPVIAHTGEQTLDSAFEDKYYVEVDNAINSPYEGYVYTPWKRVTARDSATQIVFTRSTNGAYDWSEPIGISPRKSGTSEDTTYGQSFPLLTTGADGEIFAVWNDGIEHGVGFNRSYDGGITWEEPRIIQNYNIFGETKFLQRQGGYRHSLKGIVRAETYPVVKADYTDGPHSGNLYLTWAGDNPPNIYFAKSNDDGDSWTDPIIVHKDTTNDQFWQWMNIDPTNGDIAIMYLDSRNDEENIWCEAWVSLSTDGGDTWIEQQVSDYVFDLRRNPFGGEFAGDYNGLDFYDGIIYPSWVDARNIDAPLGADNDVYTAVVNTRAPAPVNNLKITTLPEQADKLDLTWTNTYESSFGVSLDPSEIEILVYRDDELIATLDGNTEEYQDTDLIPFDVYNYKVYQRVNEVLSAYRSDDGYPGGARQPLAAEITDFGFYKSNSVVAFDVKLPEFRADSITPIVNLSKLKIFRDDLFIESIDISDEIPGSIIQITDNVDESNFYRYYFTIETEFKESEWGTQESDLSNEIFTWSGPLVEEEFNYIFNSEDVYYATENWNETELYSSMGDMSLTSSNNGAYSSNQKDTVFLPPFNVDVIPEAGLYINMLHMGLISSNDKAKLYQVGKKFEEDELEYLLLKEFNESNYEEWADGLIDENDWKEELIAINNYEYSYLMLEFESNGFREAEGWYIDFISLISVGVENEEIDELNVYPNPSSGHLFVNGVKEPKSINIYAVNGNRLDFNYYLLENGLKLDISNLSRGIYILEVDGIAKKIIKD